MGSNSDSSEVDRPVERFSRLWGPDAPVPDVFTFLASCPEISLADRLEVLPPRSGNIERAHAAEQAPAVIAHHDGYRAAFRALAWSRHVRSFPGNKTYPRTQAWPGIEGRRH